MVLTTQMPRSRGLIDLDAVKFPPEVEMILSAIETGQHGREERRVADRRPYRTQAALRLFSDAPGAGPSLIYVRDANRRGLGFITNHRLPLGYGGVIELRSANGQMVQSNFTLIRCREAAPGWYEGSLYFNREQPQIEEPMLEQ